MYRESQPFEKGMYNDVEVFGTKCPRCGENMEMNVCIEGEAVFCPRCGLYFESKY